MNSLQNVKLKIRNIFEVKYIKNNKNIIVFTIMCVTFFLIAFLLTISKQVNEFGIEVYQNIFQYDGISLIRFIMILIAEYFALFIASNFSWKLHSAERFIMLISPAVILIFFAFPIIITWDVGHYHTMIPILNGDVPWSQWDSVRGIVFPFVINLGRYFFGATQQGMLTLTCIAFLTFLLFCSKILCKLGFKPSKNPIVFILFTVFVVFNPLVFGGFHALLCEFLGATITIISCYVAWKWYDVKSSSVKLHIYYIIYLLGMTIISYHLKQPYIAAVLFPFAMATLISIIRKPLWRDVAIRFGALCISGIITFVTIISWNSFLRGTNPNANERMITGESIFKGIVRQLPLYKPYKEITDLSKEEVLNDILLDEDMKNGVIKIIEGDYSKYSNATLYDIVDVEGKIVDRTVLWYKEKNIPNQLGFLIQEYFRHPKSSFLSNIINYLDSANILNVATENGVGHYTQLEYSSDYGDENKAIFSKIYFDGEVGSNIFYMQPLFKEHQDIGLDSMILDYSSTFNTPILLRSLGQLVSILYSNSLYKLLVVLFPVIFILSLLITIIKRKDTNFKACWILVLIAMSYAFLQTAIHAVFISPIDRYTFASFCIALISTFGLLMCIVRDTKLKSIDKSAKNIKHPLT